MEYGLREVGSPLNAVWLHLWAVRCKYMTA